jgi:hypothetical protein
MVHGSEVLDETKLDGRDETFFYTGGRPSAIRVLEIFPPDEARNGKKSSQQKMRSPSSSSSSGPVVRDEVTSFGDRESPRPMVVPFVEAQGPIGTPSGGGSSGGGGSTDAWGDSGSGGSSDSSGSDFLGHPRAY